MSQDADSPLIRDFYMLCSYLRSSLVLRSDIWPQTYIKAPVFVVVIVLFFLGEFYGHLEEVL